MRIVFGAHLGDGGWPGPLGVGDGARAASLDEAWVALDGLVALLEVRLGVAGPTPPRDGERAAALTRALQGGSPSAPWARSLAVDAFATARVVLRLADALVLAGVPDDATGLPPRLDAARRAVVDAIAAAPDGPVAAGAPRRARRLCALLEGGDDPRVESLEVVDDTSALPGLTKRLLRALAARGAHVQQRGRTTVDDDGRDLARARATDGQQGRPFVGDGSIVLLRPDTVDAAAAEVAAALDPAVDDVGAPVVVIGGDAVLDEALARRHLPTLGARGDAGHDAMLSLLPLTLALAERHADPERLFQLCSLPVSVLPPSLTRAVRSALLDAPSALSPKVLDAVRAAVAPRDDGRAEVDGDSDDDVDGAGLDTPQARLVRRLTTVVPAWGATLGSAGDAALADGDGALTARAILERCALLTQLLFGRQRRDHGDDERTPYQAALRQVHVMRRLVVEVCGGDDGARLTRPQRERLVRLATESVKPLPVRPAGAGFNAVRHPGAVCGPASTIVWWPFTADAGRMPASVLFASERQALLALGFEPGEPRALAAAHAAAARRPLDAAVDRLILVAPQRAADGREQHPHPLWDELVARMPSVERRTALRVLQVPNDRQRGLTARAAPPPRPRPKPRALHVISQGSVSPRDLTSPSREELMLGCALRFVLEERGARARPHRLKRGVTLEGDVVHAVIGAVCDDLRGDDTRAKVRSDVWGRALAAFDEVVPGIAGAWLLPGREQVRLRVRLRAARATVALVQLLELNDLSVRAVEAEVERPLPTAWRGEVVPRVLKGTPDLVVDGDDATGRPFPFVIDHKTGGEARRRALLRLGVPAQLLAYARLIGDAKREGPAGFGYFIVRTRTLLTSDDRIEGVERVVAERTPREGWRLLEAARATALADLAAGKVRAPGALGDAQRDVVIERDALTLGAPCAYCAADAVCGRAWTAHV